MSAVAAHEATRTYLCVTPSCPNIAKAARGPYSYCSSCRDARGIRPGRKKIIGTGGHEERALNVARAAKKLDRAIARHRASAVVVEAAKVAYQEAIMALGGSA